jgi:hypothetical protein
MSVVKRLRLNHRNRLSSSSEVAVRSNVKHDALSSHSKGRNRSNSSHVDNRSRSSVGKSKRKVNV